MTVREMWLVLLKKTKHNVKFQSLEINQYSPPLHLILLSTTVEVSLRRNTESVSSTQLNVVTPSVAAWARETGEPKYIHDS